MFTVVLWGVVFTGTGFAVVLGAVLLLLPESILIGSGLGTLAPSLKRSSRLSGASSAQELVQ